MRLHFGQIPVSQGELDCIEQLVSVHPTKPISYTRRDPGETGPVLVHVGAKTYEIRQQKKGGGGSPADARTARAHGDASFKAVLV